MGNCWAFRCFAGGRSGEPPAPAYSLAVATSPSKAVARADCPQTVGFSGDTMGHNGEWDMHERMPARPRPLPRSTGAEPQQSGHNVGKSTPVGKSR